MPGYNQRDWASELQAILANSNAFAGASYDNARQFNGAYTDLNFANYGQALLGPDADTSGGAAGLANRAWAAANPGLVNYTGSLQGVLDNLNGAAPRGYDPSGYFAATASPTQAPDASLATAGQAGFTSAGQAAQGSYNPIGSTAQGTFNATGPAAQGAFNATGPAAQGRFNSAQAYTAAQAQGAQAYAAQQQRANGGMLFNPLQRDAAENLGRVSQLQSQQQQIAGGLLGAGGDLSAQDLRNVQQDTRGAFAARGLYDSNQAIGAEVMNTDAARRNRLTQNLGIAQGVDAAGQQQLAANRGYTLGVQGQGQGLSTFNAGQGNQLGQFNAGLLSNTSTFNAGQVNDTSRFNAGLLSNNSQFNAGRAADMSLANAGATNQGNQFNAGRAADMSQWNAGATNQQGQFNAAQAAAMSLANAGAVNQMGQYNAGRAADMSLANAGANNQMAQWNAGQQNLLGQYNTGLAASTSQYNAGALNNMGQFGASLLQNNQQYNTGQLNAANQFNSSAANQSNQYNAGLQSQNLNDAWSRAMQYGGLQLSQAQDPNRIAGTVMGNSPDYTSNLLGYGGDYYNSNFNAINAANISGANNSAAKSSAYIQGGSLIMAKSLFMCIPEGQTIDTPTGPVAIENLRPGDRVTGYGGQPVRIVQHHGYLEDPTQHRFVRIEFEGSGHTITLCDNHKLQGVRSRHVETGDLLGARHVKSKTTHAGVCRSYDLLTTDAGYQIHGVPVNSMIEEMAAAAAALERAEKHPAAVAATKGEH